MAREHEFSRRAFLAGVTGLVATSNISAAGQSAAPLEIAKTVQKLYKVPESREPNDLQFVPEGLWILDQVDPNRAILVVPEDGSILRTIQTESLHGSGITFGDGALWIGSTSGKDRYDPPRTLKVDPMTGKTLKSWVTTGYGYYNRGTPENSVPSGAHGLKWTGDKYWMAAPAAGKIFLMEPETGAIVRGIPGPGTTARMHGLAVDGDMLWCVNSDDRAIFKLDAADGTPVAKIQLAREDPVPHGLDIDSTGTLWYCDAGSGWICRLV